MPTRDDRELEDRAVRALRAGQPVEALGLYDALLRKVTTFESGVYETWLSGALSVFQALGRKREAGFVLVALRRFAEAEACFARGSFEWSLCVAKQGRPAEAAQALGRLGHPTLAAIEFEAAGAWAAARGQWERVLRDDRLIGCPYEQALAQFNLGQSLRQIADESGARTAFARTQQLLEQLADDFETRGQRERAFDCYRVLLRLGKDTGSFENVCEGYMNAIRLLQAENQRFYVLQFCEDFLVLATQSQEWHAAATVAGDAADYCLKVGLDHERHYRERAAALWVDAARHNLSVGGSAELSENALVAALDAATRLGDLPFVGRLYAELAALPLAVNKRQRYATLAGRPVVGQTPAPGRPFPASLRRTDAYQDVWRLDLVEWDLGGRPVPVLAQILVERVDHMPFVRLALRALLPCVAEGFDEADEIAAADLALALGRVQVYEILRPLARLGAHPAARVRSAVMTALGSVYYKRTFVLLRQGLEDPEPAVRAAALGALRSLHFRDGYESLVRLYRDSADAEVRQVVLATIGDIGSPEAATFLGDLAQQEGPSLSAPRPGRLTD